MTSAVDIANLALSHIGQDANIASLSPPEESYDAMQCARFYPIARDMVLEEHAWTFASRRRNLALLATTMDPWRYSYALPTDCLKPRRVMPQQACEDLQPMPFLVEDNVLYTNVKDAILVYTYRLIDTGRFPPLVVSAISWLLASQIAGPILKDTSGNAATRCFNVFTIELAKAKASNANSDRNRPIYVPSSIRARYSNYPYYAGNIGEDYTVYPSGFEVL